MLLLWRKQLSVLLGAESLSLQHVPRFSSQQRAAQYTIQLPRASENTWQNAVGHLDATLAQLKMTGTVNLNITISSEFVRYLVLPPQGVAVKPSEKKAFAQAFFNDIYGDIAQTWQITVDDAAPHLPALAVAIDQALYTQMIAIANKHEFTLTRLEPFVTTAVNFLAKEIGRTNGYLAIVEQHRVLLLKLQNGQPVHLKVDVIRQHWQQALTQLLTRKDLLNMDEFSPENKQHNGKEVVLLFTPFLQGGFVGQIGDFDIKAVGVQRKAQPQQHLDMLRVMA